VKKGLYIGILGMMVISLTGCGSNLAKVNDTNITKDDYNKTKSVLSATNEYLRGQSFEQQDENLDKDGKKKRDENILSFMVDNEIVYQSATAKGIKVSKDEVETKYSTLVDAVAQNPGYKKILAKAGVDDAYLKKTIEKDLVLEKYKKDFEDKLEISDADIQDYYSKHKDDFTVPEVSASQILVSTLDDDGNPVSSEEKSKSKEKADKLLNDIKNGAVFADVAKSSSDDKATGKNGGELGYFTPDKYDAEFSKHVFNVARGDVSKVFETSFGYHIVKITDKKDKEISFHDARNKIIAAVTNEKYAKHISELEKSAEIKR
jgi:parvulin-like peptidyl-prolyl isomerase